jgi:hypothetical protein
MWPHERAETHIMGSYTSSRPNKQRRSSTKKSLELPPRGKTIISSSCLLRWLHASNTHGVGPPRQSHGGGPCAPPPATGRPGVHAVAHTPSGKEHLAPQPPPPSASNTHSSPICLPSYVSMSVRDKGERGCFAVRNLTKNYPVEGGEPMDSKLRRMVCFSTLAGGARQNSSPSPGKVDDDCLCAQHLHWLVTWQVDKVDKS